MRRVSDVLGALVLLALAAPLLLFGATVVLLTSGRPIFFGHTRIGRGGRKFKCWKLRTMTVNAERVLAETPALRERYLNNDFKVPRREDPRVTRAGHWLRRTYLDELPQLFNVLNGTMSLVGPRPIVEEELAHYGPHAAEFLTARPGIFGAWAAAGRARAQYPERVDVELEYVRGRNAAVDLGILLRSIPVVLQGQAPDT